MNGDPNVSTFQETAVTRQETKPNAPDQGVPSDRDAHLPYDRDEQAGDEAGGPAADAQRAQNRQSIVQAHEDVENGIQDTERRGIPTTVPTGRDGG